MNLPDWLTSLWPPAETDDAHLAFVGCSPRSGSTLLTRILDSHSRIAAPCELALPQYFSGDRKERLAHEKYREICAYYRADPACALARPRYLFSRILRREKKSLLVLKDPRQSLFLAGIARDFPQARFIHLVRDARSIAMSAMFQHNPQAGLGHWLEYHQAVCQLADSLPAERFFRLRYEDLVAEPAHSVAGLVAFLGETFEPEMLDYGRFPHADERMALWNNGPPQASKLHHALQAGQIDPAVLREKTRYSAELQALYRQHQAVRALNQRFGYQDAP